MRLRGARRCYRHDSWLLRKPVGWATIPFDGEDEAISKFGQRFYELWTLRGVFESLPHFFDGSVNAMLEVDECVLWPEGSAKLLAGDDFAFRLQEQA